MLRVSLRFLLPLLLTLGVIAYAAVPLIDDLMLRWFLRDLDARSLAIAAGLREPLGDAYRQNARGRIRNLLATAASDERLFAAALCDMDGELMARTPLMPRELGCDVAPDAAGSGRVVKLAQGAVHVARIGVELAPGERGAVMLVHDMSFVQRRSTETRWYVIGLFSVLGLFISIVTVFVAQLSWRGWVRGVRAMLSGEGLVRPFNESGESGSTVAAELRPLEAEVRSLLKRLERESAVEGPAEGWSPDRLRGVLQREYKDDEVIVISNREPYSHEWRDGSIVVTQPASGLVTALEPVLVAAGGMWIAHGSGGADREVCNANGDVSVPPEAPTYTLRRIWLSDDEIKGYYEGFSNEGIWPLCHMAHVRPVFRSSDWIKYQTVNERFATAVVKAARRPDPLVLVQDYHLALVPQMIRARLPQATVLIFWHIPWPMPEAVSICPWRKELLAGLLGSHIIGFQTPVHCRNFIDSVDAFLETRIERESGIVHRAGQLTQVAAYPISIAWPQPSTEPPATTRARILGSLGLPQNQRVAVGIDRMDYIKGLMERFAAVEQLLQRHPQWRGRFTLLQIAAPSRSDLPEYSAFQARVAAEAQRINREYGTDKAPAIVLKMESHPPAAVQELYRVADLCLVTSLHDGMNLVAKEFIAARDDEQGVLLLSSFMGAARELHEALIVNPYSAEETAEAIARALSMPSAEQRERMHAMRSWVSSRNVYRWAGKMLQDAAYVRARERVNARIERLQQRHLRVVR